MIHRFINNFVVVLLIFVCNINLLAETLSNDTVIKSTKKINDVDSLSTVKDLDELVVERSNVIRCGNTESYIVTEEMRKGKYTAGELLRNISGMDYHPMSEEVTYLGSTKVVILLDSVPKDEAYIKRQSPNRFDRIDIVQHPGGIYKDYDVLINYHPRPHYTGFETNTKIPLAIMPDGNNGKGNELENISPYIDATYMYDKLTLSANALWSWQRDGSSTYSSTEFPLNNYSEVMVERDRKNPIRIFRSNKIQGQLSGDYKFNDKHKLSLLWQISSSDSRSDENYTLDVNDNFSHRKVDVGLNNSTKDGLTNTVGLYYMGEFGKWELSVSSNYINISWKSQYGLNRSDDYSLLYDRKGLINYYYFKVDFGRPFMNYKWQLNFDVNATVNNTRESELYSGSILTDTRVGLYNLCAMVVYSPNERWAYYGEIGMTLYNGKDIGFKSTKIEPRWQVNIHWMPTNNVRVNGFYLMQTMSPQNSQIQGYGQFVDKFKFQEGNPLLKSGLYNMAYLGLTLWNKFTVFGQYDFTNSAIYNIYSANNTNQTDPADGYYYALGRYQNGRSRMLTMGANLRQSLTKGFSLRFNGTVRHYYTSYNEYNNKIWIPSSTLGLWYENNKYHWMGVFSYGFYGTGSVTPQLYSRKYSDRFDLMVRKGFLKNSLLLALQWTLPMHIANGEYKSYLISPNMIQHSWSDEQFRYNNRLSVSISYRFNTGKQIKKSYLDVQSVSPGSSF